MVASALDRARTAFEQRSWASTAAAFAAADGVARLDRPDLERWATASHLLGQDAQQERALARAYRAHMDHGDGEGAARCAFWLGFSLQNRGDAAQAGGWLARARRVLDDAGSDSVHRGYLLLPVALRYVAAGDVEEARAAFGAAGAVGERFGDTDLVALSRHGVGRALINLGRADEGVALLDEAMLAVTAGDVSPVVAGIIYCSVIEACQECYDLRRAQEWTAALTLWCRSQPDLVPFGGQCLVHRTEIMALHGAWSAALDEARLACEHFARTPGQPAIGAARYQEGELHRLRGELDAAERDYAAAGRAGHEPQPGLALLRLAQGRPGEAEGSLRRGLAEGGASAVRPRLLAALTRVLVETGRGDEALPVAAELTVAASRVDAPMLHAMARFCTGSVDLARGDPADALTELRSAWSLWRELGVPYEAARSRVLVGLACRALGDEDSAQMELDAAAQGFALLGAVPDHRATLALGGRVGVGVTPAAVGPLTPREVEVLRLVCGGLTNRAIAAELVLSERTVARHVSNILGKLGVPSRAAATAWAYEHDLAQSAEPHVDRSV